MQQIESIAAATVLAIPFFALGANVALAATAAEVKSMQSADRQ